MKMCPHKNIYKNIHISIIISSVQSLNRVWLPVTQWTAARQASLFITNPQRPLKLLSIESLMPSNHFILCCPLLLLPSILPSIRVLSNESVLRIIIECGIKSNGYHPSEWQTKCMIYIVLSLRIWGSGKGLTIKWQKYNFRFLGQHWDSLYSKGSPKQWDFPGAVVSATTPRGKEQGNSWDKEIIRQEHTFLRT